MAKPFITNSCGIWFVIATGIVLLAALARYRSTVTLLRRPLPARTNSSKTPSHTSKAAPSARARSTSSKIPTSKAAPSTSAPARSTSSRTPSKAALSVSRSRTCQNTVSDPRCCQKFAEFMRPRHPPQPEPSRPADKKCRRILLIIVFNSALYDHAPFLRSLYKPTFDNIVLYGPTDSKAHNVTGCKRLPPVGLFLHILLVQVTVEHPGYDDYMWVADDQVFNYRLVLPEKDPEMIWMNYEYYGDQFSADIFGNRSDWSWQNKENLPALRTSYPCIPKLYLNRTVDRYHCKDCMTLMMSDFGYLPRRFVNDFRLMAYALRRVHMEISIPNIFFLISNSKADIQVVDKNKTVIYAWGNDRNNPVPKLKRNTRLFHPIKLYRHPALQKLLRAKLNKIWGLSDKRPLRLPWLCPAS